MITDAQLDAQLDVLQARTPAENDQFASVADFKARFFARAHAAAEVTPKSANAEPDEPHDKRSFWERLLHPRGKPEPAMTGAEYCLMESARPSPSSRMARMAEFAMAKMCWNAAMPMIAGGAHARFGEESFVSIGGVPDDFNTEEYRSVEEKPFVASARNPLSTFGADVDTAGYTNARRMILENGILPPADSVRVDEFLNYFRYDYPAPKEGVDVAPHFECADAPWNPAHKLLLVGLQARDIPKDKLPPSHYVFLIDNSGSMGGVMDMVKEAVSILTRQLRPQDKVSLVTYGGGVHTLLAGCGDTQAILKAVAKLEAEGFTPGGEAIQKAYALAHEHFIPGGNNRIVLVTDGDFNVGASSEADLTKMVEKERGQGIYLSVVGAGSGNYKDNRMKMLANKGDGNYIYIDSPAEARRAFTQGLTGQMYTLAHDAKFQLEFNPARVYAYRLLGYELRHMEDADFRDDTKDSGEIGVGQQVTALYELVMADAPAEVKAAAVPEPPPLRYSTLQAVGSDELLTFHLRYLPPQKDGDAVEQEHVVADARPGANLTWAATVAEFALLLRDSKYKGDATYESLIRLAKSTLSPDTDDDRLGFFTMLKRAAELAKP